MKKNLVQLLLTLTLVTSAVVLDGIVHIHQFAITHKPHMTLVLSPHFDDAVLSLGGMISHESHAGNGVYVMTVFTGEPVDVVSTQWDHLSGFTDSHTAVQSRIQENDRALASLGLPSDHIINIGLLDRQYRTSTDAVVTDIQSALDVFVSDHVGPDVSLRVYGPAEFGPKITHPDHELLHRAFTDWIFNAPTSVTGYIYEDFPYVNHFIHKSGHHGPSALEEYLEADITQNVTAPVRLTPEVFDLTSDDVHYKIAALAAYSSQVEAFTNLGGNILSLSRQYTRNRCGSYACEVLYKIER